MRVVLFGAGENAENLLIFPLQKEVEITLVCDNDPGKWGRNLSGYVVEAPEKILRCSFDLIVISSTKYWFVEEIRQQLLDMGIDGGKIAFSAMYSEYVATVFDQVFCIEKKPRIPFAKKPVEIKEIFRGETFKSHERRKREGFFEKYCQGEGLDIGYGGDILMPGCSGWDIENGDAQYMDGIEDESFDFVYSSHCLEHMVNVRVSLQNWFRIVKPGGYLILAVPHRDLYEKKKTLPSRWNMDHKHMFLLGRAEKPDTLDIMEEIRESLTNYDIKYAKACDEGHTITDPLKHSDGEYQIEVVVQKQKTSVE